MRTAIFANGEIEDYGPLIQKVGNYQTIVAVDGGIRHCLALELIPHIIIGDMDSSSRDIEDFFPQVKVVSYDKDKDESDLELAIDYCNFELSPHVSIFGGLGGYTDHALANLLLLKRYKDEEIHFVTDNEIVFAIKPGHQEVICPEGFSTVSLMPIFGRVKVNKTAGLTWEIEQTDLDASYFSLSNRCSQGSFTIDIEDNLLLCSLSNR